MTTIQELIREIQLRDEVISSMAETLSTVTASFGRYWPADDIESAYVEELSDLGVIEQILVDKGTETRESLRKNSVKEFILRSVKESEDKNG